MEKLLKAAGAGLAGSVVLTLVHETARQFIPDAPRMDILGMRALEKGYNALDEMPPGPKKLHNLTLAADIVSNAAYYSLIGSGKNAWLKGAGLGLAAGLGGVLLPGPLGLGKEPSNRTPQTQVMTVAWYLIGGLAAAVVAKAFNSTKEKKSRRNKR
jgi:hypothetical protein